MKNLIKNFIALIIVGVSSVGLLMLGAILDTILYRLRLDQGRLKADRLIVSPYYELKETTISNVLGPETEESNRDEWRMAIHNLIKYFQENE